jgi:nucleoside-diphosphate-sugar epimerase
LTGAGGFIGRHVSEALLACGFEVHGISRVDGRSSEQLTWHTVDLFDSYALEKLLADLCVTHLIHLAWVTEPGEYWQSPQNLLWQHASVTLLKSFEKHGGERAVLAGTCAEYDWTNGHCVEDKTPHRAKSKYTQAKLAFRAEALALATSTDLSVAWGRVFFPFGPHERRERLVASVISTLLAGERAACSDGEQIRDFIYVRDLASAFVALLDSNFSGNVNIASGRATMLKDLVNLIADKLDARDRVDFGARPRQAGDPPKITADVTRLKNAIGWTPQYSWEAAVDETIAWWRTQAATTGA